MKRVSNREPYVQDFIVPVMGIREDTPKFLGSGFFLNPQGLLITCRHVVDNLPEGGYLSAYLLEQEKELRLEIHHRSARYDLALCKSRSRPGILERTGILEFASDIDMGDDVEVYGYWYEPRGEGKLPFRRRYMKGHVTGIPIDPMYPDSFELSFPVLSGMSGSPLLYHAPIEGESKKRTCVAGCVYGSRTAEVVKHRVTIEKEVEEHAYRIFEHTEDRIIELGLAYKREAIHWVLGESGTSLKCKPL